MNLKKLAGKRYVVSYDDRFDGRGVEFYIVAGLHGYIGTHHNEGSLTVACNLRIKQAIATLNDIGLYLFNRNGNAFYEIDAADFDPAAEAICAQWRSEKAWHNQ